MKILKSFGSLCLAGMIGVSSLGLGTVYAEDSIEEQKVDYYPTITFNGQTFGGGDASKLDADEFFYAISTDTGLTQPTFSDSRVDSENNGLRTISVDGRRLMLDGRTSYTSPESTPEKKSTYAMDFKEGVHTLSVEDVGHQSIRLSVTIDLTPPTLSVGGSNSKRNSTNLKVSNSTATFIARDNIALNELTREVKDKEGNIIYGSNNMPITKTVPDFKYQYKNFEEGSDFCDWIAIDANTLVTKPDGVYKLEAKDKVGHTATYTVTKDSVKPYISINGKTKLSSRYVSSSAGLKIKVGDYAGVTKDVEDLTVSEGRGVGSGIASIVIKRGGKKVLSKTSGFSETWTTTIKKVGTYNITIKDKVGNVKSCSFALKKAKTKKS